LSASSPDASSKADEVSTALYLAIVDGLTAAPVTDVVTSPKVDSPPALAPDDHPYSAKAVSSRRANMAERVEQIAAARSLNLGAPSDRRVAEAFYFKEEGATVATAVSFAECQAAALRDLGIRPESMRLGVPAEKMAESARIVMQKRPDLLPQYGTSARVAHEPDAAELRFSEAVERELESIDILVPESQRISLATRRALAKDPTLSARRYGWR